MTSVRRKLYNDSKSTFKSIMYVHIVHHQDYFLENIEQVTLPNPEKKAISVILWAHYPNKWPPIPKRVYASKG